MAWWITGGVLTRADDAPAENSIRTEITGEGEVLIPEGVTTIGDAAFKECMELTRIVICEGVTGIGNKAFRDCPKLKRVSFPDGLISIENEAFAGCTALTEAILPKGLKSIGVRAFFACSELTRAVVPEGVVKIEEGTFSDCVNLAHIALPDSLKSIGYMAFRFCRSLTEVVLPEGIALIGGIAFYDCRNLESIHFPQSVAFIGRYAIGGILNGVYGSRRNAMPANAVMPRSMTGVGFSAYWNREAPMIPSELFSELRAALLDAGDTNGVQAIACPISPKDAPAHLRLKLCVGFAVNREKYDGELCAEYLAYIKKNAAKLIEAAFEYPVLLYLMCAEKLIAAKDMDLFTEEAAKRGNVELTAALLDYQANALSAKDIVNARGRREKAREKQDETVIDRMAARADKSDIGGLNFAVTGALNAFVNREELKAYIAERGGKLLGAMSAKTDYLITNDTNTRSAKNKKAAELGIEIITESEFLKMTQKK